jgi:hypothetical protein
MAAFARSWRRTVSGPRHHPSRAAGQEPPLPDPLALAGCALFPPGLINICQCPLSEAHTAFVFLRGQPPGNRDK